MTRTNTQDEQARLDDCVAAMDRIPGFKVHVEVRAPHARHDGIVVLTRGARTTRFGFEFKRCVTAAQLAAVVGHLEALETGERVMLLATHIAPNVEQMLRERRVPFFETAGNCYVEDVDLLIWIEGRPKIALGPTIQRAFRPAGLRVGYLLLRQPLAIERTYRELARSAGIAVSGLVPILIGLRLAGFLEDTTGNARRLRRLPDLLDRWTAGYLELLRPKLMVRTCRQAPGARLQELLERKDEYQDMGELQFGGELGAATLTGDLRPTQATLYWTPRDTTQGPEALARLMRALRLVPDAHGPVTILRGLQEPADWANADPHAAHGHQVSLADPLLLRAEILAGEPTDRLRELADDLFQRHIRTRWPK